MTKLTKEKLEKINALQQDTISKAKKHLSKSGKCLIVRPTGFGKNKMSADIAREYNKVVFVYPFVSNKESIEAYNIEDAKYHTYSSLRNLYKKGLFGKEFRGHNNKRTIFVLDECHFIGGSLTGEAVEALMKMFPNAKFLGITATPKRSDSVDIKWHFFNGNTVTEYTIVNALEDGLYEKPRYVHTAINQDSIYEILERKINRADISAAKKNSMLNSLKKKINPSNTKIENMEEIILKHKKSFENKDNYYKFICFFSTYDSLHALRPNLQEVISNVFPDCEVNIIILSCENKRYKININKINNLERRQNTVDLILNINMLTFGHHMQDITGIMMFRHTVSNIIYTQQIGRCLSVIQNTSCIIFDFVENLFSYEGDYVSDEDIMRNGSEKSQIKKFLESCCVDDTVADILNINKLIDSAITEEFESGTMEAYDNGLVDEEYCITKLNLQSHDDFIKVCEKYNVEVK